MVSSSLKFGVELDRTDHRIERVMRTGDQAPPIFRCPAYATSSLSTKYLTVNSCWCRPRNCTKGQYRLRERCNIITRAATDQYKKAQKLRLAVAQLIKELPDELRGCASIKMLEAEADDKICNIVHLIYHAKKYEGIAKDFEFSRRTMEEHGKPATTPPFAR
jgi:hypothetical protein